MKRCVVMILMVIGFLIAILGIYIFSFSTPFSLAFLVSLGIFALGFYIFKMSLEWLKKDKRARMEEVLFEPNEDKPINPRMRREK